MKALPSTEIILSHHMAGIDVFNFYSWPCNTGGGGGGGGGGGYPPPPSKKSIFLEYQFSAFREERLEIHDCHKPRKLWDLACSEACHAIPNGSIFNGRNDTTMCT